jgi:hypothetical protein
MESMSKIVFSTEMIFRSVWLSAFFAMTFSLPSIGIFLASYGLIGYLTIGIAVGFTVHFFTLALSAKISNFYLRVMS